MNAMTPIGQMALSLPHTETFDDWSNLGRRLCASSRVINWLIGDWLIEGSDRFGEKARNEANTIFRSDVERFAPIVDTCRRFPEPKRHQSLTFGHHLAVMAIEDDDQAEQLLTRAENDRLTTAALKAEVKVIRSQDRLPLVDDDPVDLGYRRMAQAWNLASRESRELFAESVAESHMGVIEL